MDRLIAVVGGASATPEETAAAEAVGRGLAAGGAVLVCGGRGGVMEAACRGAKAAGGLTLGIIPGLDRHQANAYVDIVLVTGLGEARNAVIARSAQAMVAIGGGYGTLSEMAFALCFGVPVIGLGTWTMAREERGEAPVVHVATAKEAVERALALALD